MALEDVLGINARNFSYIRAYNPRDVIRLVDNKLKTKKILRNAGLPVPETYKVFRRPEQVRDFDFKSLPDSFVVKPNSGFGGKGILVVFGRTKKGFLRSDGGLLTEEQLKLHLLNILEGAYSLSGLPDIAYIEERVKPDRSLKKWAYRGLPDIRVIVFRLVPVMAMLRLPTVESRGRANLHEGALGVGIDLATGLTLGGYRGGKWYKTLPGKKIKLRGKKIKFWEEILLLASEAQAIVGGEYLGVDIAITERGPLILELNARPGLSIQNVNKSGLRERLKKLEKVQVATPEAGVRLGRQLFQTGKIEAEESGRPVVGLVEVVELIRKKRRVKTLAKIDTGAYSCSMDYSLAKQLGWEELVELTKQLHRAYREKNEKEIKRLCPEFERFPEVVMLKKVRSRLGREFRPLVKITFKLAGQLVSTEAHLANRRHLRYPMILGRKAMRSFVVDPLKYVSRLRPFKVRGLNEVKAFFALRPRYIVGIAVNGVRRAGPE
ncbi:ATP-dependent zinc protease, partial [bacterium]|nr:ATP-dependent zinc protease [bacterium]